MRIKTALIIAPALLLAVGCTSTPSGRTISIEMTNFKLSPAQVEVKAGETVSFVLDNRSDTEHEFESDAGKFEEILVPAGKSRTVTWTAPNQAGDYEFECDMAGHDGMTTIVKVTK